METKGRIELKYYINENDSYILQNRLKHVMKVDPYSNQDGTYDTRSIYFENSSNKIMNQKLDGLFERAKYRIRIYNNNLNSIKLEKKMKKNNQCFKEVCNITQEEYAKICVNDLDFMIESQELLLRDLYIQMSMYKLKPQIIVDYKRQPFIYEFGNVRVTLDSDIKTGITNTDIFNPNIDLITAVDINPIVLEVKYDDYIPDVIKGLLNISSRTQTAISKYVLCRRFY